MYQFYLGDILLPVAPSKLNISIKNQNKTVNLINDGEINILKKAGLTDIEFEILLPQHQYPFATYKKGFKKADYYLDIIRELKTNQEPFQFIVARFYGKSEFYSTNIKVSIEDYSITEDTKNGIDVVVKIKLKQFVEYSTKTCTISVVSSTVSTATTRETTSSPAPTNTSSSYTVVKGDCLWNIAKHFYGDGSKYPTIYNANKSLIDGDNVGTGNTVYTIYPNQVFTIPAI